MSRPIARCIHFTPSLEPCKAGIPKRDVYQGGIGPCLTLPGRPDRRSACSKYEPVSDEVLDAEERELEKAMARFDRNECPECGVPLTRQDGPQVVIWICPTHGAVARGCRKIGEHV